MTSYGIILTHNRPELLERAVAAISPQVDRLHVVDNASNPPMRCEIEEWPANLVMFEDPLQPPNLSKFWNAQFNLIEKIEQAKGSSEWDIAVLCDDAIAPEGWFQNVTRGMRQFGAAAGCTHAITPLNDYMVKHEPDADLMNRMTGWAFVLAGEKGLRADESMHWWYCDSDIDFQARANGGLVICPGAVMPNELPNAWTNVKNELSSRAGLDRQAFAAKWGMSW